MCEAATRAKVTYPISVSSMSSHPMQHEKQKKKQQDKNNPLLYLVDPD